MAAHDEGKLYGCIGAKDLLSLIKKKGDYQLDEHHIFISNKVSKVLKRLYSLIKLPKLIATSNINLLVISL